MSFLHHLVQCVGLLAFLGLTTPLGAQEMIQVASKRIDKTFGFNDGYELNIEGERAEVYIEAAEGNEIKVQLELTARHPDQTIARRDLGYVQYLVRRVKNKVYLRNYLKVPENAPDAESQIKAIYRIQVPPNCPVYTKNNYGLIEASRLTNSIRVNSNFSQIGLREVGGMIDVQSRFGDIMGQSLNGNVSINATRSDITLKDMRGSYDINAHYGILNLFPVEGLLDLRLIANKSEVYLHNVDLETFSYELSAKNGDIRYPENETFVLEEPEVGLQKVQFKPSSEYYPNISVKITFGNLNLSKN